MEENCDKKGEQVVNLTDRQKEGLKRIRKRVKDHEVLVIPTDKSGRLCLVTPGAYEAMGKVHTTKDKEVGLEEAKKTQELLNGHVSMWIKGFSIGEDWNHLDRIRETTICHDGKITPMYLLIKDHKTITVGCFPVYINRGLYCQIKTLQQGAQE